MPRMSDSPQQISSQQKLFCFNDGRVIEVRDSQQNQRQNVIIETDFYYFQFHFIETDAKTEE